MERLNRNAPALLLAAAALVAAVVTLVLSSKMSFYADTWELLMNRRDPGVDTLLQPHNEHWVLFPTLFEQLFLRLFGMTSALPEYVLLVAFLVVTAALVFIYVRRRVGPWLGLFAAVLVLFLGPAWEVLLWPFEISFCGPILFGLAALLALEREDRRGDLAACACLTGSLGFSSLGVPFIVGAAVALWQGERSAWRPRAYVVAVPALVFAAWYIGWGHDAESHLSLRNLLAAPRFLFESVSLGLGNLVGLGTSPETNLIDPSWGKALLIALVIGCGFWIRRRRSLYAGLWPIAAVALTNWLLTAFNAFAGRDPTASRYQYAGAIFIVLILANLFQGVRLGRNALIAGAVLTALAVGPNLVVLDNGSRYLKEQAVLTRSDTAALEIARETVEPQFQLDPEVAGTPVLVDITAERYFQAIDEYGSPAYSVSELNEAPEAGRRQADIVLSEALPISVITRYGAYADSPASGCVTVGDGEGPAEVPVADGSRVELAPGPTPTVSLRRFAAAEYPVPVPGAAGESSIVLKIPADGVDQPWFVHVEAAQEARVCPA